MKTPKFKQKGKQVITNVQNFIFEAPPGFFPSVETLVVSDPDEAFARIKSILRDFVSDEKADRKKQVVLVQDLCPACADKLPQLYKRLSDGRDVFGVLGFTRFMDTVQRVGHKLGHFESDEISESMVPIGEKIGQFTGLFAEAGYLLREQGQIWLETPSGDIIPLSGEDVGIKLREVDGTEIKLESIPLVNRDEIVAAQKPDEIGLPSFPAGVFKVAA